MDSYRREFVISRSKDLLIPDRIDCPVCSKSHRVRQEGLMHFFICKKTNRSRFFVGWNNTLMIHPPPLTQDAS